MNPESNRIIYGGIVQPGDCDAGIGRIRVFPDQEKKQEILNSLDVKFLNENQDDIKDNYRFTEVDPFVFLPLLPLNLNYEPSVGEYVHIMYSNVSENPGRKNQFYMPGPNSTPMNLKFESQNQTRQVLAEGPNIRDGLKIKDKVGQFKNKLSKGVFAEREDFGIYGKGKSDIIIKDTEVLIRANKTKELSQIKLPEVYDRRSFLQLSYFETSKIQDKDVILKKVIQENNYIKKLIEYDITAGLDNSSDSYTGTIKLYNVPNIDLTKTATFNQKTELGSQFMTAVVTDYFQGIPKSDLISRINDFIKGVNEGNLTFYTDYTGTNTKTISLSDDERFPFYFRPSLSLSSSGNLLNVDSQQVTIANNTTSIVNSVLFVSSRPNIGYGLVSAYNKSGQQYKLQTQLLKKYRYETSPVGYTVMGADNLYLLSHLQSIPGKSILDLGSDTVYGIDREKLSTDYKANTEGLVRGDSLKQLLNLIVNFLVSHTHPHPMIPPVPTGVPEIQAEMNQFDTKVINQNIRIN
jgi:hypothetical protein